MNTGGDEYRLQVSRLHELAAALAGALTPSDVVAATVQHTADAFLASGTVVALLAEDGAPELELIAAADMPDDAFREWHRFPLSAPAPLSHVARTGRPVFLESLDDWNAQFPEVAAAARDVGHQANAVIPLRAGDRVIGVLGIAFREPRHFSADERDLALTVAHQCAVAIERARLYERERTARREADAARSEAENASLAKTRFLATMSHELRTPLNAIAGYAELLSMGIHGPVTEEQRQALARIHRNEQHLLGLIDDVLNFAKLDSGQATLASSDVQVRATINFVSDVVRPQLRSKQLDYQVSAPSESLYVRGDPDRIRQILINLLSNALKFTEAGGTVAIWCEVDPANATATVNVRDSGCGIPADKLQQIFDPFVQLDRRSNRPMEGAGLGLAISRDLAHLMGGSLTVTSTVGAGSTFSLRLPIRPAADGP